MSPSWVDAASVSLLRRLRTSPPAALAHSPPACCWDQTFPQETSTLQWLRGSSWNWRGGGHARPRGQNEGATRTSSRCVRAPAWSWCTAPCPLPSLSDSEALWCPVLGVLTEVGTSPHPPGLHRTTSPQAPSSSLPGLRRPRGHTCLPACPVQAPSPWPQTRCQPAQPSRLWDGLRGAISTSHVCFSFRLGSPRGGGAP